jgi:hypothetical protein
MKTLTIFILLALFTSCTKEIIKDNQIPSVKLSIDKHSVNIGETLVIRATTTGVDTVSYNWAIDDYPTHSHANDLQFSSLTPGAFIIHIYATSHNWTDEDTIQINVYK